jgi:TetR/AcrR family transcriptional regulator, transcriptional repressor for nem operon
MGRPRAFGEQAALEAALMVFWRSGYAAASLDDLTAAMGLSRSSFYGAFGSKHDVLLAAVRHYVDDIFAKLQACAAGRRDPTAALRAIFHEITAASRNNDGCLLVNSIAELAPDDRDVCSVAQGHVSRVLALMSGLLVQAGHAPDTADPLAGALLSCAFGAATLRKAGLPNEKLTGLIAQAERLLTPPL